MTAFWDRTRAHRAFHGLDYAFWNEETDVRLNKLIEVATKSP